MPNPPVDSGHVFPTGTLTFLFTDVEGSTRLWEQHPEAMALAHARHGAIITACVESQGGHFVRTRGEGDSTFSVFSLPRPALIAAADLQRAFAAEPWPPQTPLRVRAALHTGTAVFTGDDYNSSDVNRCARLRALAVGGQTLLSTAAFQLICDTPPDGVSLQDLGSHRLKDLSRPEHIYQALPDGLPADFPPLQSLDARRTNLPSQMTSFVGREAEMADVRRLLTAHRLLTLTGPGGSGKTRLALQAAAESIEDFPDGVWVVELSGLSDPALLPQVVAQALCVREEAGQPLPETLAHALSSKTLLLLLDNCEYLLPACERLAETLLRACPSLRLLATSQQPLGIVGTGRYPVPALALPPSRSASLWEQGRDTEAVRLFAARAAAVRPAFALTPANVADVAQICRRLAGIPLAIELAAAWADVLTPDKIAARLSDRLRLLTRGNYAALPCHQTLRAAIDWSHALLADAEKALFARLSVFAGGWTLEAAEAVCTGEGVEEWDILPLLSRLVDKSLVAVEPQGDSMRYSLLESLRQYSQEQAPAGIAPDALAERCAAFFLAFGADAEAHLDGPEEAAWLNRLEQEQDNIRAVLDWSLGHDQETCLRLAGHVYWLWYLRGYQSEWRSWLEAALARSQDVPAAVRAKALTAAGTLAWSQGEMDVARVWYEQALAVRKELADRREIAGALNNLGLLAAQGGDTTAAAPLLEESLDIYRVLDDRMKVATLLSNLGRMACDRKDHAVAAPLLFESRVLFRELNSLAGEAVVLGNLGEVFRLKGEYAKAVELLSSSLVHRKELGDASGVAEIWRNLGLIAFARGDATQALEYLAADHCLRVSKGMLLHPAVLEEIQEALDALRSQLGPSIYEDIWHQTQILPSEQFLERHRLPGG